MKTYVLANQKGGVAKTTTAGVLAEGLALQGHKVLAVDCDPQMNLSYALGASGEAGDLYDVLRGDSSLQAAISATRSGVDVVAGSLSLAGADMEFTQTGREYRLREALETVKDQYTYCVLDTPPTLGILTINALTAASSVIIPMEASVFSLQGLSQLVATIESTRKYSNSALGVEGLLLTKFNPRTVLSRDLADELDRIAQRLGTKVFQSTVREAVSVREAQLAQQSVLTASPGAKVSEDYSAFIKELLEG